jgi:hypothetical protein
MDIRSLPPPLPTFFCKDNYGEYTDIDKCYPVWSFGLRTLAMGAVHPDMAIIEKYFRGVIPKDLDAASKIFQHTVLYYQISIWIVSQESKERTGKSSEAHFGGTRSAISQHSRADMHPCLPLSALCSADSSSI